jgi:hypothetical protein
VCVVILCENDACVQGERVIVQFEFSSSIKDGTNGSLQKVSLVITKFSIIKVSHTKVGHLFVQRIVNLTENSLAQITWRHESFGVLLI